MGRPFPDQYPATTCLANLQRHNGGNWKKGQSVYIIKVNGVEYIKTVDNEQARDNLENLPEF
jgi:hypothetical protein